MRIHLTRPRAKANSSSPAFLAWSSAIGSRAPRKHKSASERMVSKIRSSWANSKRTQSGRRPRSLSFNRSLASNKARSISGTGTCSASSQRTSQGKRAAVSAHPTSRATWAMSTEARTKTARCLLTQSAMPTKLPDPPQQTFRSFESILGVKYIGHHAK